VFCCRYTENQFDSEFIDVLRETCYRLVQKQDNPHASLSNITAFINSKGLARVELQNDDIQQIMDTLVYDGRVEVIEGKEAGDPERYRPVVLPLPAMTAFTSIPCGVCPVFQQCVDGGEISPQTCVYYQAWLDF
jgi:DNA-directed RNA polymerase III subunit RPC6